jgi:hypothetical protein
MSLVLFVAMLFLGLILFKAGLDSHGTRLFTLGWVIILAGAGGVFIWVLNHLVFGAPPIGWIAV